MGVFEGCKINERVGDAQASGDFSGDLFGPVLAGVGYQNFCLLPIASGSRTHSGLMLRIG